MSSTSTSTFGFKDDKSSKFWEVTQASSTVTVRYGKTRTNGQTQEKVCDDASAASILIAKLLIEKTGKAYVDQCATKKSAIQSVPGLIARIQ